MNVHIDDSEFIDLINAVTADEIAALESSVEDLESELSDKADEEYVDDLATDLRAEWQQEIENAIDNIEAANVDSLEDEVNEIQRELICVDERQANVCTGIMKLETRVAELDLEIAEHLCRISDYRRIMGFYGEKIDALENTFFKRTYRKMIALSRKINWYSPKL